VGHKHLAPGNRVAKKEWLLFVLFKRLELGGNFVLKHLAGRRLAVNPTGRLHFKQVGATFEMDLKTLVNRVAKKERLLFCRFQGRRGYGKLLSLKIFLVTGRQFYMEIT
jgi:hypothetical protein